MTTTTTTGRLQQREPTTNGRRRRRRRRRRRAPTPENHAGWEEDEEEGTREREKTEGYFYLHAVHIGGGAITAFFLFGCVVDRFFFCAFLPSSTRRLLVVPLLLAPSVTRQTLQLALLYTPSLLTLHTRICIRGAFVWSGSTQSALPPLRRVGVAFAHTFLLSLPFL